MPASRRDFIRLGALGTLGAGLEPPASAAILVWLSGGLSHLDTFDMKPGAPREIRGEFRSIATSVPGIRICEHLPRIARQAHRLTIVRSLCGQETNHERASAPAGALLRVASAEPRVLELYGDTPLGHSCLAARRAVEGGARFAVAATRRLAFDTHTDNFSCLKGQLLPEFDRAFAALLQDLHSRGLLDSTLVIAMGEFGRSPRINPQAGRDHHAQAFSAVLAGGGLSGGRVLGATDRIGAEVTDAPLSPADLFGTVCARLRAPAAGNGRLVPELLA